MLIILRCPCDRYYTTWWMPQVCVCGKGSEEYETVLVQEVKHCD
jgi:hypothetical protein